MQDNGGLRFGVVPRTCHPLALNQEGHSHGYHSVPARRRPRLWHAVADTAAYFGNEPTLLPQDGRVWPRGANERATLERVRSFAESPQLGQMEREVGRMSDETSAPRFFAAGRSSGAAAGGTALLDGHRMRWPATDIVVSCEALAGVPPRASGSRGRMMTARVAGLVCILARPRDPHRVWRWRTRPSEHSRARPRRALARAR